MKNQQHLQTRTPRDISSSALNVPEAIEQQVREHPVVQEIIRVFDAQIDFIEPRRKTPGFSRGESSLSK